MMNGLVCTILDLIDAIINASVCSAPYGKRTLLFRCLASL